LFVVLGPHQDDREAELSEQNLLFLLLTKFPRFSNQN